MKRAKKKTKRQRKLQQFEQKKETEQKMQQQVISDTVQKKSHRYYPIDSNDRAWLIENRETATSDRFLCRILANGYVHGGHRPDKFGTYDVRSINNVKSTVLNWLRDENRGTSTGNRRAVALAIYEVTSGTIDGVPVQQELLQNVATNKSIVRVDEDVVAELKETIQKQNARIDALERATAQKQVQSEFTPDVRRAISDVDKIMKAYTVARCLKEGRDAIDTDHMHDRRSLYDIVGLLNNINIPLRASTGGGSVIEWLARNGLSNATLKAAIANFSVGATA